MHGRREEAPPLRRGAPEREAIDLLWADPSAAPKILRAFGDLLADLAPPPDADPEDLVVRVLGSGRGCDASGLEGAMAGAVGPDGRFRPPLVLVAGDLAVAFDELETLRATLAAALPFAAGDRRLRGALDEANDLLATPGLDPATGVTADLAERVRGALAQGGRAPPGHLTAQVERTLLERRAYQRRALLGGDHLRALVTLPGAEAACPVYLPEALAASLPMFPAFEARILAEAHHAQDQAEAHPAALHALALGRVLPGRRLAAARSPR